MERKRFETMVSIISLCLALIAIYLSWQANTNSQQANEIAQQANEIAIKQAEAQLIFGVTSVMSIILPAGTQQGAYCNFSLSIQDIGGITAITGYNVIINGKDKDPVEGDSQNIAAGASDSTFISSTLDISFPFTITSSSPINADVNIWLKQTVTQTQSIVEDMQRSPQKAFVDIVFTFHTSLNQDFKTPKVKCQLPSSYAAHMLGNPNATVSILEFCDYLSPYCAAINPTVRRMLVESYIETNKVNFVFSHMAFLGQESLWAAQAAECAADQGKFWEFHDYLSAHYNDDSIVPFTKNNLINVAKVMNLDMAKFEPCLINDQTLSRVQADTEKAKQLGLVGVPTFLINGQPLIIGAQPIEVFRAVIDRALGQ
jgi:protein-disulfide isomerase